jgi:hypothetical protein
MTRTPFFWALIYVHSAFGLVALWASIAAFRARRQTDAHRRLGWWFVQALAGIWVTTAMMASIRYTFFLFVIGYAAWYSAHQAWLCMAPRDHRTYLGGRLALTVQHDVAIVLGVLQVAAAVAMLFHKYYPITPGGLGLGVAFVWGSALATLGWAERSGRMARLRRRQRHVIHIMAAVALTWSEFIADVTVHFMRPTFVWVVAWIAPAVVAAIVVHRIVDLRACALALFGSGPTPPQKRVAPGQVAESAASAGVSETA